MTPERRRRVEQLYWEASSRDASEREKFLREACADDEEIRIEVESLLEREKSAQDFLEVSVLPQIARGIGEDEHESWIGRHVGTYQILSCLGSGGMGVVFKAQDTRLPRLVALKFLKPEFSGNRQALERFKRE